MGGESCPKMDFNPITIRHGRVGHLYERPFVRKLAINKSSLQPTNALDRFINNAPNALVLLLVAFFQVSSIICIPCCEPWPFLI